MGNACVIRLETQPRGHDFGSNRVQGQRLIDRLLPFNMDLRWPLMLAVFHEKSLCHQPNFFVTRANIDLCKSRMQTMKQARDWLCNPGTKRADVFQKTSK